MAELGKLFYELGIQAGDTKALDAIEKRLDALKNFKFNFSSNFEALKDATTALENIGKSVNVSEAALKGFETRLKSISTSSIDGGVKKGIDDIIAAVNNFKASGNGGDGLRDMLSGAIKLSENLANEIGKVRGEILSMKGGAEFGRVFNNSATTWLRELQSSGIVIEGLMKNIAKGDVSPISQDATENALKRIMQISSAVEQLHAEISKPGFISQTSVTLPVIPVFEVDKLNKDALKGLEAELSKLTVSQTAMESIYNQIKEHHFDLSNVSLDTSRLSISDLKSVVTDLEQVRTSLQQIMHGAGQDFYKRVGQDVLPKDFGSTQVEVEKMVQMIRSELEKIVVNIREAHIMPEAIQMIENELKKVQLTLENVKVGSVDASGATVNGALNAGAQKTQDVVGLNPEQINSIVGSIDKMHSSIACISKLLGPIANDHIDNIQTKMLALAPATQKVKDAIVDMKTALDSAVVAPALAKQITDAAGRMSSTGYIKEIVKGIGEQGDVFKWDATATQMKAGLERVLPLVERYRTVFDEFLNKYSEVKLSPDNAGSTAFANMVSQIEKHMDRLQQIYSDGEKALDHFVKKQNEAGKESASAALTGTKGGFEKFITDCEKLTQILPVFDTFVDKAKQLDKYKNSIEGGIDISKNTAGLNPEQLDRILAILTEIKDVIANINLGNVGKIGIGSVEGLDSFVASLQNVANQVAESVVKINEAIENIGKSKGGGKKKVAQEVEDELAGLPAVIQKTTTEIGGVDYNIFANFFASLKEQASKLGGEFRNAFSGSTSWFEGIFNERDGQKFLFAMNEVMIKLGDLRQKSNLGLFEGPEVNAAIDQLKKLWDTMNGILVASERLGTTHMMREFLQNPMEYRTEIQNVNALLGSQRNQNAADAQLEQERQRIDEGYQKLLDTVRRNENELRSAMEKNGTATELKAVLERYVAYRKEVEQSVNDTVKKNELLANSTAKLADLQNQRRMAVNWDTADKNATTAADNLAAAVKRADDRITSVRKGIETALDVFSNAMPRVSGKFEVQIDTTRPLEMLTQLEVKLNDIRQLTGKEFVLAVDTARIDGTFKMLSEAYRLFHQESGNAYEQAKKLNADHLAVERTKREDQRQRIIDERREERLKRRIEKENAANEKAFQDERARQEKLMKMRQEAEDQERAAQMKRAEASTAAYNKQWRAEEEAARKRVSSIRDGVSNLMHNLIYAEPQKAGNFSVPVDIKEAKAMLLSLRDILDDIMRLSGRELVIAVNKAEIDGTLGKLQEAQRLFEEEKVKAKGYAKEIEASDKKQKADAKAKQDNQEKLNKLISQTEQRVKELNNIRDNRVANNKEVTNLEQQIALYERILKYAREILATGNSARIAQVVEGAQGLLQGMRVRVSNASRDDATLIAEKAKNAWYNAADAQKAFDSQTLQTLKSITSLDQQMSMLAMNIQNAFSIIGLQQFANKIIEIGGELERQQLAMGSIFQDQRKADSIYRQVADLSMKSPFDVQDLVKNTKQLSAFGIEYEELYDTTKRLSDIAAGVGVEFGRIAYEYGQMESMGYLDARHLRMFSMSGIPLLQKLQEYYSQLKDQEVGVEEIRKMIFKKQIDAETVKSILRDMTNEGGAFYNMQEVMAESLASKWRNYANAQNLMYGEIAQGAAGEWLKDVAEVLTNMTEHWQDVARGIAVFTAAIGLAKIGTAGYAASQQLAAKAAEKSLLVEQGYAVTAAEELIAKNALTAADYNRLAASNALSRSQLVAAVATSNLSAAEKAAILTKMGLTEADVAYIVSTDGATAATVRLQYALMSVGKWLSANVWMVAAVAVAAVGTAIWNTYTEAHKLDNELEEIHDKMMNSYSAEANEIDRLCNKLHDETLSQEELDRVKDTIFSKYGQYLGNLNKEAASYDEVAAAATRAKDAIMAKLRMQMQDDQISAVNSNYDERIKSAREGTKSRLKSELKRIGYSTLDEDVISVMTSLEDMVIQRLSKSDIENRIRQMLGNDKFNLSNLTIGSASSILNPKFGFDVLNDLYGEKYAKIQKINNSIGHLPYQEVVDTIKKAWQKYIDEAANESSRKRIKAMMNASIARVLGGDKGKKYRSKDLGGNVIFELQGFDLDGEEVKKYLDEQESLQKDLENGWKNEADIFESGGSNIWSELKTHEGEGATEYFKRLAESRKKAKEELEADRKSVAAMEGNEISTGADIVKAIEENEKKVELIDFYESAIGRNFDDLLKGSNSTSSSKEENKELKEEREKLTNLKKLYDEYNKVLATSNSEQEAIDRFTKGEAGDRFQRAFGDLDVTDLSKFRKNFLGKIISEYNRIKDDPKLKEVASQYSDLISQFDNDQTSKDVTKSIDAFKRSFEEELESWDFFKSLVEDGMDRQKAYDLSLGKLKLSFEDFEFDEEMGNKLKSGAMELSEYLEAYLKSLVPSKIYEGKKEGVLWLLGMSKESIAEMLPAGKDSAYVAKIVTVIEALNKARKEAKNESDKLFFDVYKQFKTVTQILGDITEDAKKKIDAIDASEASPEEKERLRNAVRAKENWDLLEKGDQFYKFFNAALSLTKKEAESFAVELKNSLNAELRTGVIDADEYAKKIEEINAALNNIKNGKSNIVAYLSGGTSGLIDNKKSRASAKYKAATRDIQDAEEALRAATESGSESEMKAAKSALASAQGQQAAAEGSMAAAEGFGSTLAIVDLIVHGINNLIQGLKAAMENIDEMNDALGNDYNENSTGRTFLDAFSQASGQATSAFDSFKNGDIGGMISGVVGSFTKWVTVFAQHNDAELQEYIDRSKERVDDLKESLDRAKQSFKGFGYDGTAALERINSSYAQLSRQTNANHGSMTDTEELINDQLTGQSDIVDSLIEERDKLIERYQRYLEKAGANPSTSDWVKNLFGVEGESIVGGLAGGWIGAAIGNTIDLYGKLSAVFGQYEKKARNTEDDIWRVVEALNALNAVGIDSGSFSTATDLGKVYMTQYENLVLQRMEIESQLANEEEKKNTDDSAVEEYKNQINELNDEIRDFVENMYKDIYGLDLSTWASEIGDALTEAFAEGEDAVAAFDKTVDDLLRNVAKRIISQFVQVKYITPLMEEIFGKDGEGGIASLANPEESIQLIVARLAEWNKQVGSSITNDVDAILSGLEANGVPIKVDADTSSVFDGIKDDLKSALLDSEKTIEDMMKSISEKIAEGMIDSILDSEGINDKLDDWKERMDALMKKRTSMSEDEFLREIEKMKAEYQEIIEESKDAGDHVLKVLGLLDEINVEKITGMSFDSISDDFKSALMDMTSGVEDFTKNMKNMIGEAITQKMLDTLGYNSRLEEWLTKVANMVSESPTGELSKSQLDDLEAELNRISDDAGNDIQNVLLGLGIGVEELADKIREDFTGSTFDSMRDNFHSMLMDMDKGLNDFMDDLNEKFMDSALTQWMENSGFNEELKAWQDAWAQMSKSDGGLNSDEIAYLRSEYERLIAEAMAKRDELGEMTDYNKQKTSSMTSGIKSITEETANIIAAYVNGIRQDTSVTRDILEQFASSFNLNNVAASSQLAQLQQQTEYLRQINEASESMREGIDSMNGYMRGIATGSYSVRVK
ncbi:MAG: hypothetical protein MJZ30_06155 [Paludibacteraceae bacterium]|nr:hypothetical protein [Paludibacteraceae bacterium]